MGICPDCGTDHEEEAKRLMEVFEIKPEGEAERPKMSYKDWLVRFMDDLAKRCVEPENLATLEVAQAESMSNRALADSILGKEVVDETIEIHKWIVSGECKFPFNTFLTLLNDTPDSLRAMKGPLLLKELCRLELLEFAHRQDRGAVKVTVEVPGIERESR